MMLLTRWMEELVELVELEADVVERWEGSKRKMGQWMQQSSRRMKGQLPQGVVFATWSHGVSAN